MPLTEVRSTETPPEILCRLKSLKLLFYLFTPDEVFLFFYYFLCIINNNQSGQQHHAIVGTLLIGVLFSNVIVGDVMSISWSSSSQ